MKITTNNLIHADACNSGIMAFGGIFPDGFDGEWTPTMQALCFGTELRRFLYWAKEVELLPCLYPMTGWDLRGADLYCADLRCAVLNEADLRGADLREANLFGADLLGANLTGARLAAAVLRGADLSRADLRGVDLSQHDLSGACLRGARRNPDDHPIPHWRLMDGELHWAFKPHDGVLSALKENRVRRSE